MFRTLTIFGTRPEAIKMAPLVKGLEGHNQIKNEVCVTAQHREMLDQVLDVFDIKPTYDLQVMAPGQDLSDVTGKILTRVRDTIRESNPDLVLVHGDTTTCFASALAAFYEGVNIAHVEAGLRTGDLSAPFPEEANRCLVSKICNLHYAPTQTAKQNLIRENVDETNIFVTGNTVIDALFLATRKNEKKENSFWKDIFGSEYFERFSDRNQKLILITGHRRENFGGGFISICNAIKELAVKYPTSLFVYPVHLNPKVKEPVHELLGGFNNVLLIEPLSYQPFVWLMNKSDIILTDSGGIQEEGPALGKPVLVMRDVTERPEAVSAGTVKLVGTDTNKIFETVSTLLDDNDAYKQMSQAINPYGDGLASERIIQTITSLANQGEACQTSIKEFAL